jgi:hypothetical protein
MEKLYYIKRLDELNGLFHDIYYDYDDAIELKVLTPTIQQYRKSLEDCTEFLPSLKKDFPEHTSLVDSVWTDIKDLRDKLAGGNYHLAAIATFATGKSVQALTAAMIEKMKSEPAGNKQGIQSDPKADFQFTGSGDNVSQVFFQDKLLPIPPGNLTAILKKLADAKPVCVKYSELGSTDIKGADEKLRTYKSQLDRILKKHTTYEITTYTGSGYSFTPTQ